MIANPTVAKSYAIEDIRKNGYLYITLAFLLLCGMVAGYSYYLNLTDGQRIALSDYVISAVTLIRAGQLQTFSCFIQSILPYLWFYLVLGICALHVFMLPIVAGVYLVKGIFLGFYFATLLGLGNFGIAVIIILSMLLPKVVCIGALGKSGCNIIGNSAALFRRRKLIVSFSMRISMSTQCYYQLLKYFAITCVAVLFESAVSMLIIAI